VDDDDLILEAFICPTPFPGFNSAAFPRALHPLHRGVVAHAGGYVLIYYFLPLSVRKPDHAHKLSLVGCWVARPCFYPFVASITMLDSRSPTGRRPGDHHAMLLIIPVWTVLVKFLRYGKRPLARFGKNLPAKFLIMGSLMYLLGCFQGSTRPCARSSSRRTSGFRHLAFALTVSRTFVVWASADSSMSGRASGP